MSDFFEIDPFTGISTRGVWSESENQYQITRTADVEDVLEFAKTMRNEGGLNRADMMKGPGWWQYASIPPIVMLQMRAKGINIYDPAHSDRMLAEINSHYPHIKTTTGKMGGKVKLFG